LSDALPTVSVLLASRLLGVWRIFWKGTVDAAVKAEVTEALKACRITVNQTQQPQSVFYFELCLQQRQLIHAILGFTLTQTFNKFKHKNNVKISAFSIKIKHIDSFIARNTKSMSRLNND
jgi:hypothetical protein